MIGLGVGYIIWLVARVFKIESIQSKLQKMYFKKIE